MKIEEIRMEMAIMEAEIGLMIKKGLKIKKRINNKTIKTKITKKEIMKEGGNNNQVEINNK